MPTLTLQEQFGQIDIYLFDQLLKGRVSPGTRILDAGCGSGRNLVYLLREGYEVYAADSDAQAVDSVRSLAGSSRPRFRRRIFEWKPLNRCLSRMLARMWWSATPSSISPAMTRSSNRCCTDHGAFLSPAGCSSAASRH